MFALLSQFIGNGRWATSGFLTRLSNGGPPQVPGTHAGTRGAGEFDGIIAAVKEDEIYYHRDQCDMITMVLRLAAEPAWGYERGRQATPAADRNRRFGGCGTRVIDQACLVLSCLLTLYTAVMSFEILFPVGLWVFGPDSRFQGCDVPHDQTTDVDHIPIDGAGPRYT